MTLAIYAVKCNVDYDELKKDAYDLIEFMNRVDPQNEFTRNDVESALECYDERYNMFPRDDISKLTAIDIPKNKRNGRSQKQHISVMNAIREITHPGGSWRNKNGAPSKEQLVKDYIAENQDKSVTEIARALNVSRPTVYKYK